MLRATSLSAAALIAISTAAQANTPQNMTLGEIARLPPYCIDAQGMDPRPGAQGTPDAPTPRQAEWVARMGKGFWAVHHYCWALLNANRAAAAVLDRRRYVHLHDWAIQDCYYVIRNVDASFPLLPEIYTRVGEFNMKLERPVEAMEHYEMSRRLKPDYWPPYLGLAQVNSRLGRRNEAIQVLNEGLKVMPDEPNLVAALRELENPRAPRARPPAHGKP
jgi:tetratricopeptide (TPR) repeat protein